MAFKPIMGYTAGSSPTFTNATITGDLTVQGNFNFGDVSTDVLTMNGQLHLVDDAIESFGNTAVAPDSKLLFSTVSAGANMLRWQLPTASANNIPWLVLGNANVLTADFTSSAGMTEPGLALLDASATKDFNVFYSGSSFWLGSSTTGLSVNAGGNLSLALANQENGTKIIFFGSLDADTLVTDPATPITNAYDFTYDVTYTGNTTNAHRTFLGTLILRGTAIDYGTNPQTVAIFQGDNYTTGTTTLLSGASLNIYNQGAGTITEAHGLNIRQGNLAGGTYTEFSGIWMSKTTAAAATTYAFNFADAAYLSNSRSVKVKNAASAAAYLPMSTTDTGITFDSTNLVLATTTTGDVLVQPAGKTTFTGQYASAQYTCTTTLNWNNGNVQYIQLANGSQTFTFANPQAGGRYMVVLKQPAGGAAGTVVWPTVSWPAATAPTLTTTNSYYDIITFVYDGTNGKYFGGSSLNYA